MLIFGIILSISMVASYPIHRRGCQPLHNKIFELRAFQSGDKRRSTHIFYRDEDSFDATGVEQFPSKNPEKPSDFQHRMKSILVQKNRATSRRSNSKMYRPRNVKMVVSLEEYAAVIEEGRREGKVVVARFYANWCKTCHSIRPSFDKAASSHPQAIFLDVPVLKTNAILHQGLGVESVPFGHIYHPEMGLIEEMKLSRKKFPEFENLVKFHCNMT